MPETSELIKQSDQIMITTLPKHLLNWLRYKRRNGVTINNGERREKSGIYSAFIPHMNSNVLVYGLWLVYCVYMYYAEIRTWREEDRPIEDDHHGNPTALFRKRYFPQSYSFGNSLTEELFTRICLYVISFCFGAMYLMDHGIFQRYHRVMRFWHYLTVTVLLLCYMTIFCMQNLKLLQALFITRRCVWRRFLSDVELASVNATNRYYYPNNTLNLTTIINDDILNVLTQEYALLKDHFLQRLIYAFIALSYTQLEHYIFVYENVTTIAHMDKLRSILLANQFFRHIIWCWFSTLYAIRLTATVLVFGNFMYTLISAIPVVLCCPDLDEDRDSQRNKHRDNLDYCESYQSSVVVKNENLDV